VGEADRAGNADIDELIDAMETHGPDDPIDSGVFRQRAMILLLELKARREASVNPSGFSPTLHAELERIRGCVATLAGQNKLFCADLIDGSARALPPKHWVAAADLASGIQREMSRGPRRVVVGRCMDLPRKVGDIVRVEVGEEEQC